MSIFKRALRKIKKILKNKKDNSFTKEKFIKKIKKYDIISFDIFDTLVTRTIYSPDDIFLIIGGNINDLEFIKKRKEAEVKANIKLDHDVNLDEIYEEYKNIYKIDKKEVEKIKNLEISLELDFITARCDMLDVLKELKKLNKKVILTSDMYLCKETIIKMLEKCGYTSDLYSEFYLSNDIDKRKDRKDMWPYLKEEYKNLKIVHIGDNILSDYNYPKEYSIDSIKIKSGKELFSESLIYENLKYFVDNKTLSDSIYLGLLINKKVFNSPFSNLKINTLNDFAYSFHAPILYEFIENVSNIKENSILFLAREGYYFQKLYKEYIKLNNIKEKENYYFLASRKATSTSALESDEDIYNLTNQEFVGTIKDYFHQVLEIDFKEKNFDINLPNDHLIVNEYIKKYIKQIKQNIKNEKENYLSYINSTIKDFDKKDIAIVDLGYSGTIQYNLSKLTNKEFIGYYLTNSENVKKYSEKSKLNFLYDIKDSIEYKKIYHYSLILEYFLSAPFGQLQKFTKKGKNVVPVYNDEKLDDNKKASLDAIYNSVLEYMDDIKNISKYIEYKPNKDMIVRMYVLLVESGIISLNVKNKFDFIDSFSASGVRNVFKIISRY